MPDQCEVCGTTEDVRWWDDCPTCGPAPLCADHAVSVADRCAETHGAVAW